MNILIDGFGGGFNDSHASVMALLLEELSKEVALGYCCVINVPEFCFPQGIQGEVVTLPHRIDRHLYKNVDWNTTKPLDSELLVNLSFCESTFMKMMERGVMTSRLSYVERKKIYLKHVRYINHLLEERNIQLYLCSGYPDSTWEFVIYSLCKIKGIHTFLFHPTPIPGQVYFAYDIEHPGSDVKKIMDNLHARQEQASAVSRLSERTTRHFQEMDTDVRPFYHSAVFLKQFYKRYFDLASNRNPAYVLRKLAKMLSEGEGDVLLRRIQESIYSKLDSFKTKRLMDYYEKCCLEPKWQEKFIYVALHHQPECSTVPMAGIFSDQQLILQILSYAVPDDVKIFVKEHPYQTARCRNKEFYDEIKQMRNVCLVSRNTSSLRLVENSVAVVTATGTVGWEAIFKEKPVMMFGYFIYQYVPGVFQITNIKECEQALTKILVNGIRPSRAKTEAFCAAMEQTTFEGLVTLGFEEVAGLTYRESIVNYSRFIVDKMRQYGLCQGETQTVGDET